MEPARLALAAFFFGIAGLAFFLMGRGGDALSVTGAELVPVHAGHALRLGIANPGPPDVLTGVASDAAQSVTWAAGAPPLAVPAGGTPSLALDGAHPMLTGLLGEDDPGHLVSVTLWFERSGKLTTRARIVDGPGKVHGALYETDAASAPRLTLSAEPDSGGWRITLSVANLQLTEEGVDGVHVPGEGHAHLYLNGLKLRRVYGTEARIGALPPGEHELRVTLNTHDHRSYAVGGRPVEARLTLAAD